MNDLMERRRALSENTIVLMPYITYDGYKGYIDSEANIKANTKWEVDFRPPVGGNDYNGWIVVEADGVSADFYILKGGNSKNQIMYGGVNTQYQWQSHSFVFQRCTISYDGRLTNLTEGVVYCNINRQDLTPTKTLRVFFSQLYGIRVWEGKELVRNLVPAKKGKQVGMYDTVNNNFHPIKEIT